MLFLNTVYNIFFSIANYSWKPSLLVNSRTYLVHFLLSFLNLKLLFDSACSKIPDLDTFMNYDIDFKM